MPPDPMPVPSTAPDTQTYRLLDDRLRQLLGHIVQGQEEALIELYSVAGRPVYTLAARLLRDHHLAEETTADVFLQIWKQAERFDAQRGNPRTWLMTIARSRTIDRLRAAPDRPAPQPDLEGVEDRLPGPERVAHDLELQARVRGSLAELPSLQRAPLELAYFGGLSQTEIATRLSEPLGTIKTRMRLGLKKLRDHLSAKDQAHGH